MLYFYENYIRLCNQAGKTPSAVAKEIGIQKSTVTRWKNGKGRTDATVQKVADYFGVSKAFLLNSVPDPEEIILVEGISEDELNDITEHRIIAFENRQKEKPTTEIGSELSPAKQKAWDFIQQMDDETLDRFIAAAKAFTELD